MGNSSEEDSSEEDPRFGFDYRIEYSPSSSEPNGHQSIRFSFNEWHPVFVLDRKGRLFITSPRIASDYTFEWSYDSHPEICGDQESLTVLSLDGAADRFHQHMKRKSPEEETFKRYHTCVYQGRIDKQAKRIVSAHYNYGIKNLFLFASVGLKYRGTISSLYMDSQSDHEVVDSQLEIFRRQDTKEIIVFKLTNRKSFKLKNLSAEVISEHLKDKDELDRLVQTTRLPAVCGKLIEECL